MSLQGQCTHSGATSTWGFSTGSATMLFHSQQTIFAFGEICCTVIRIQEEFVTGPKDRKEQRGKKSHEGGLAGDKKK